MAEPRLRAVPAPTRRRAPWLLGFGRGAVALALLLALLLPLQGFAQDLAPVPPLDSPVVDTTGTLDPATVRQLESQALALQQRKGSQLQVLVVPTTLPEDIAQYAVRVYDQWRLGREDVDDGVLLVVAIEDRRVRIEVGYGLEGAIPDATASRVIQEYLVPRFRAGDFAGGIAEATGVLVALVDGEPLPEPMTAHRGGSPGGGGWLVGLFAAFIVAQVVRGVFSRAPRPLRGVVGAGASGGAALLLSGGLVVGGIGAVIGLLFGLASLARPGRYANDRGWGGGGWGGPPFGGGGFGGGGFGGGGFGGGGWGGGGGFSGGGGASGSW